MQVVITPDGLVRCVYDEAIDLSQLGAVDIRRGSHVEPNAMGQWTADMSPVDGPVLGPFSTRRLALEAEIAWLGEYWLTASSP
ncbi:hypothetical protein [Novipirellula artificiosorum]|uniref:Uncharacterized protein n=1 Tax=Novipirellula artificiosorum TaxID=2528016 RepID=A0A5C6D7P5_9BACT|nr:hypothetical protein [Novipirellula artificiosorum]TWU33213.1 hypothetical protein Poly41_49650 [Novipirellula artificiosorum]